MPAYRYYTDDTLGCVVRRRIHVSGIVQGVGFRPFVFSLAAQHALTGMVGNTSSGVVIEIQGSAEAAAAFLDQLRTDPEQALRPYGLTAEERSILASTDRDPLELMRIGTGRTAA